METPVTRCAVQNAAKEPRQRSDASTAGRRSRYALTKAWDRLSAECCKVLTACGSRVVLPGLDDTTCRAVDRQARTESRNWIWRNAAEAV
ncbi:hypothetical protein GCM10012287_20350 [Streptomyces daqingensis]|uniref:Transposase n=1 Tax=Streptomyces daqingensis TaxID=1472640 RepID=A0ABQ2M6L0_9ACTN|nr:hypothetical protein GCM10012287_20350 [Streptomyces daqingensis]